MEFIKSKAAMKAAYKATIAKVFTHPAMTEALTRTSENSEDDDTEKFKRGFHMTAHADSADRAVFREFTPEGKLMCELILRKGTYAEIAMTRAIEGVKDLTAERANLKSYYMELAKLEMDDFVHDAYLKSVAKFDKKIIETIETKGAMECIKVTQTEECLSYTLTTSKEVMRKDRAMEGFNIMVGEGLNIIIECMLYRP